ncbi:uncharacterized protein LOC123881040 [Maniola jurtina]|uniref:uncharacterized protein LOC123881040 n=1 Tax=Maniola jurtina TaxID=191418 RepID=UPI001E688013|nr:uncharacterized protein LOC123881040 [Maniola jurtina]XP_045785536.1 uncharacterized protein LOC123881040 [Maniola jurtina]
MVQPLKSFVGRGNSAPIRLRYVFLLAIIFGGSFLLLLINSGTDIFFINNDIGNTWRVHRFDIVSPDDTFTIKTEGCTIPGLNPFSEDIKKFIERPKNIKPCHQSNISLLDNNETHIWINRENLQYYDVPRNPNISCCYQSFYRPLAIVDISSMDVDDRVKYEACVEFSNSIEVMNEFVRVSCIYKERILYEQFFLFTPKKPFLSFKEDFLETPPNQTAFNVIIVGIDAISRLNFYRTMPKTLAYLKKKGAIEFYGYNKVGDNTFPNLTPILLGMKDTDLKRTCWPNMRATFDNCPFIWDLFKDVGYYTALGEDTATLGTFNFEKFGFSRTPTDYYLHTFMHESERYTGNNRDFNSYICMGNKYFYRVLLDYIGNLATSLRTSKLFGFFWEVTMSHDYLNYPMAMDDSYEKFLKKLDYTRYLDDTILIILSDHGIRWGDIRFTKQGRLEERLPLMHILLPNSFRENYSFAYENMKLNSHRLTTPFDLYATLTDLINVEKIKNENIKRRSETGYAYDRSISLFLPIPSNRTCKIADIDDHWCTCHKGQKIPNNSVEAYEAAGNLMGHLNTLIHTHPQCARLSLVDIVEVTEMLAGTPNEKEIGWREFLIVVRTTPGNGVFEATLRHDAREWSLAGSISRLNLYGNQGHCIHHYQLKLYCYCQ